MPPAPCTHPHSTGANRQARRGRSFGAWWICWRWAMPPLKRRSPSSAGSADAVLPPLAPSISPLQTLPSLSLSLSHPISLSLPPSPPNPKPYGGGGAVPPSKRRSPSSADSADVVHVYIYIYIYIYIYNSSCRRLSGPVSAGQCHHRKDASAPPLAPSMWYKSPNRNPRSLKGYTPLSLPFSLSLSASPPPQPPASLSIYVFLPPSLSLSISLALPPALNRNGWQGRSGGWECQASQWGA